VKTFLAALVSLFVAGCAGVVGLDCATDVHHRPGVVASTATSC